MLKGQEHNKLVSEQFDTRGQLNLSDEENIDHTEITLDHSLGEARQDQINLKTAVAIRELQESNLTLQDTTQELQKSNQELNVKMDNISEILNSMAKELREIKNQRDNKNGEASNQSFNSHPRTVPPYVAPSQRIQSRIQQELLQQELPYTTVPPSRNTAGILASPPNHSQNPIQSPKLLQNTIIKL